MTMTTVQTPFGDLEIEISVSGKARRDGRTAADIEAILAAGLDPDEVWEV